MCVILSLLFREEGISLKIIVGAMEKDLDCICLCNNSLEVVHHFLSGVLSNELNSFGLSQSPQIKRI